MTYKDLLDRLKAVITNHYFVETYGYGELSDIAVPQDGERPNYPYVFINPTDITLDKSAFSFNCSMICMTQKADTEDGEIEGQDLCIRILSDIISEFLTSTDDQFISVVMPATLTPFKERFQDDVVGATADLTIEYGKSIDGCNNPIA